MHHSLQIPISRLVPLGKPCDPGRHDRGAPKALLPGRRRRHRCQGARISPGFPPDFPGISPGKLLHGPRRCPGDPLLVPLSPGSAPQHSPQLCGISARRWAGGYLSQRVASPSGGQGGAAAAAPRLAGAPGDAGGLRHSPAARQRRAPRGETRGHFCGRFV